MQKNRQASPHYFHNDFSLSIIKNGNHKLLKPSPKKNTNIYKWMASNGSSDSLEPIFQKPKTALAPAQQMAFKTALRWQGTTSPLRKFMKASVPEMEVVQHPNPKEVEQQRLRKSKISNDQNQNPPKHLRLRRFISS